MHAYRKVASQVEVLTNTRLSLVLFPKCCLVRSGTPRSATLVGKCVLLTEGPATNGPFTDEALTAPAEDLTALAEVIDRAWKSIPPDWIEGEEAALEELLERLYQRRAEVPRLIECCRRSRSNPFPNWQ